MKQNFKRILYKISGEVLMGNREYGQDNTKIIEIAKDIKDVYDKGIEICITVGGGNIFRGISHNESGIDRVTGDYIGMLATVMNALALQSAIENLGIDTRVLSAINISSMCENYIRRKALRHLSKKRILIFAAGTGNPFFTTDTGAVLRGIEMNCNAILKGTSVNGVYNKDPKKYPDAIKFDTIDYAKVIKDNLRVMDISAVSMAKDNNIPIYIFSIKNSKTPLSDLIYKNAIHTKINVY